MFLLILLWAVLGCIALTSFHERLLLVLDLPTTYSDTITPAYTCPVVQSSSSHTLVEQVDKKTDCKFCI